MDYIRCYIGESGINELGGSVADPGCLSRILNFVIPDSGSRIPDPKTAAKERGKKNFFALPLFVATKITKLKITFTSELVKKKIWPTLQRIILYRTFYPKNPEKTYPGSGSATLLGSRLGLEECPPPHLPRETLPDAQSY